jgi:hypothetical protein
MTVIIHAIKLDGTINGKVDCLVAFKNLELLKYHVFLSMSTTSNRLKIVSSTNVQTSVVIKFPSFYDVGRMAHFVLSNMGPYFL